MRNVKLLHKKKTAQVKEKTTFMVYFLGLLLQWSILVLSEILTTRIVQ